MMVFNKLAVEKLPLECCLVCLQQLDGQIPWHLKWILKWLRMLFSAFGALIFFPYIRIGSYKDVLRWLLVVPFYSLALTISYRRGK